MQNAECSMGYDQPSLHSAFYIVHSLSGFGALCTDFTARSGG